MFGWIDGAGLLLLLSAAALLAGCGPKYEIRTARLPLTLGDSTAQLLVHEAEAPGPTYISVHDNEDTAVEAALNVIGHHGGRVVELQHNGERNMQFSVEDTVYTVDPNRIFTDAGIRASLDTLSTYSDAAHAAVRAFAETLLDRYALADLGVVVTIHNNTGENYSILSYLDDGDYAMDALFTHLSAEDDPDDFFFVTDRALYDALRAGGFNVVMQDNARVTDDGSLSVYAARAGVPYVNVEAQHGHFEQQARMIEYLHRLLMERDDVNPPA